MKLKTFLLLVATKIKTAEQLIKAIQRGQIQGISAKKFFDEKVPKMSNVFEAFIKSINDANFEEVFWLIANSEIGKRVIIGELPIDTIL